MTALVVALAVAVLLLAVLVAGLLRSHAEILKALHELGAGVIIGGFIAALFFPFCVLMFDDVSLAVAVSLSLLASCTVASIVALALPWFLSLLRWDPAFGSGPLSTVVQDLLSIAIYLALAAAIVD